MMLPDTLANIPKGPYSAAKKKKAAGKPVAKRVAPSLALDVPVEEVSPLSLEMPEPLALTPRLTGRQFLETPSRNGARPGDTKINQLDLSQGMNSGKSRNAYMTGPEYDTLTQAAMSTEPNRALQQGIDEQSGMYEDVLRNMPTGQVDLTPLMAMTDAMTGSKFASSYKAPGDMYDNVKMLSGLQDRAQSSRERLAQLIMNETGGLKSGQDEQGFKSGLEESQKAGFAVPQPHAPRMGQMGGSPVNVRGFYNTFENSDTVKEASKLLQAANSVQGHLQNPNWLGDSAARAGILQAMRLAPVSNLDVKQITGSQDLFNQYTQLVNRLSRGDVFTARDRQTIEKYNDYIQRKANGNLETAADEYSKAHAPFYGFDYQTGRDLLKPAIPKMEQRPQAAPKGPSLFQQLMEKELAK